LRESQFVVVSLMLDRTKGKGLTKCGPWATRFGFPYEANNFMSESNARYLTTNVVWKSGRLSQSRPRSLEVIEPRNM
jgi:hypothetical protein